MQFYVFTIYDENENNGYSARVMGRIRDTKFQAAQEIHEIKACGRRAHVLYLDEWDVNQLKRDSYFTDVLSPTGREKLVMYVRALKLDATITHIEVDEMF